MRIIAIVLLAVALSGCATYAWYKPDVTADAFARDQVECQRQAALLARDYVTWVPPYWAGPWGPGPYPYGPWYEPYGPPWHDPGWRLHFEQDVFARCMQAKGYELRKVDKRVTPS